MADKILSILIECWADQFGMIVEEQDETED